MSEQPKDGFIPQPSEISFSRERIRNIGIIGVGGVGLISSQSDDLRVAVGFNPRVSREKVLRRGATLE